MPPITSLADVQVAWNGPAAQAQIRRAAGKGLRAAALFLAARVKELLSVPAPRARARGGYRATTPASPGTPPRKLSGRLRASVTSEVSPDGLRARVGTNVVYARRLELGFPQGRHAHPYLSAALTRWRSALERILRG